MTTVDFYFDFSCPWSYLALVRLRDVTDRNGAAIRFKPVSVHALLATENPSLQASRLSEHPAKAVWQEEDLQLWARFWGLTIRLPANWPGDLPVAATAMLAVCDSGDETGKQHPRAIDFALRLFVEYFAVGTNIEDAAVLREIAAAVAIDPAGLAGQIGSTSRRKQLEHNTLELIHRGGFGTPSMFISDQLFFGNDRIPLVEWMLGPIGNDEFVMPGQHSKI